MAIVMSFETDFKGGRLAKQIKTNFVCGWCHYEMERSVSMLTAHCQRLVPQELLVLSRSLVQPLHGRWPQQREATPVCR